MKTEEIIRMICLSIEYKIEEYKKDPNYENITDYIDQKYRSNLEKKQSNYYLDNESQMIEYIEQLENIINKFDCRLSLVENRYFLYEELDEFYSIIKQIVNNGDPLSLKNEEKIFSKLLNDIKNNEPEEYDQDNIKFKYYSYHSYHDIFEMQAKYHDINQYFLSRLEAYGKIVKTNSPDYKIRFIQAIYLLAQNTLNLTNDDLLQKYIDLFLAYDDELFKEEPRFEDDQNKAWFDTFKSNRKSNRIIFPDYSDKSNFKYATCYKFVEALIDRGWDSKYKEKIEIIIKKTHLYEASKDIDVFLNSVLNDFSLIYNDFKLNYNIPSDSYQSFYNLEFKKYRENQQTITEYFDKFASKLYLWLRKYNNPDFDNLIICLEKYFELFDVDCKYFKEIKLIHDYYKEVNKNNIYNLESHSNPLIINKDDIVNDSIFKDIDLNLIKNNCINWYDWVVCGQYFYTLLNNNAVADDYSGCIIYWCKCVEDMSKKLLFDKIEKAVYCNPNKYQTLYKKIDKNKQDYYSLGTNTYLFNKDSKAIKEAFEIVKNAKISFEEFEEVIEGLISMNFYRKGTAHVIPLTFSACERCRNIIFISKKIIKILSKLL